MGLRSIIATPAGKRGYTRKLFATLADRYDFITGFLSYGQDRRWKQRLIALAGIGPRERVLDVACGTGDLLFAAAGHARYAVGLDLTHRMLQLADRRTRKARATNAARRPLTGRQGVAFVAGDMLALPFGESCFDVATTGYGLRNAPDLAAAIQELLRVLVPGGRLLSLDFNKPGNRLVRSAYLAYLTGVGSTLGFVLHGDPNTYRYIPESLRQYPGATDVAGMMEASGFTDVRVVWLLRGLMAIHMATKPTVPATAPARRVET